MPGNRQALLDDDLSAGPAPDLPASPATSMSLARPVAAGRPGAPGRRRFSRAALRLISPVAVLALWQLVSSLGLISKQKLPPPTEVWSTAVSLVTTNSPAYGTLQNVMLGSLERVAIGFAI